MEEETITITKKEHDRLMLVDLHMDILQARGVDNWMGYCGIPYRPEGMTDEEYARKVERAMDDI